MINTNFTLSKNGLLLLRRICSVMAVAGTAIVLLLMLFGFVPLGGRTLTVTSAINYFFYVLDFGSRSFINIIASVGLAILYYVVCIKTAISIFQQIKKMPLWLKSKMDSEPTRKAALDCTRAFDNAFFALCLEMILSKALLGGALTPYALVVLIILALVAVIIGAIYFYIVNRDLGESIVVNLCRLFVLAGAMLFAFLVCDTDFITFWSGVEKFFIVISIEELESAFMWDAFLNTVLFPIFQLISLCIITKMAHNAIQRYAIKDTAKTFLKYSFTALAIIVISNGILCSSRNPKDYLMLFVQDGLFVLVPLFVFLTSKNLYTLSTAQPYMEDDDNNNAENENEKEETIVEPVTQSNDQVAIEE